MIYKTYYNSPVGEILIASDSKYITGLCIEGQTNYLNSVKEEIILKDDLEIFNKAKVWLDKYFKGERPAISEIPFVAKGSMFREMVWEILCEIPYGKVTTYGEIAKTMAKKMNKKSMSAQAVGGAVGHNPISIIIPCHRVIGSDGSLTGYAGGIDKKIKLLEIEEVKLK